MSGPSIVDELLRNSFASRSYVEKVKIVQDGRPKPDLKWEAQLLLAALLVAAAGRPAVEEGSPAVEEGSPAVEEGSPVVEEGSPVVEEGSPVVEEGSPAAEEGSPAAEEDSPPDPPVEVLLSSHVQNPDGSFSYSYEQTDGQAVDVRGEQRQIGEEFGTVMRGSYSFVGDDGVTYTVTWVADENGFQAEGDHLPS